MLQGFGQDSFPDFEATGHARKIGTYFQRTFHSDAVSGLELKDDYQNPSSSKIIHRIFFFVVALFEKKKKYHVFKKKKAALYFSNF